MANKQNTVSARLSPGLFSRFVSCVANEVAARPRVDKMDEYNATNAVREAVLSWVEAMEADHASKASPLPPEVQDAIKHVETRIPPTRLMRASAPSAKKPTK